MKQEKQEKQEAEDLRGILKKFCDIDLKHLDGLKFEKLHANSFVLDYITDGGIPFGAITQFYGPPSIGKSTLSYWIMQEAQRKNLQCLVVDSEGSLTSEYVKALGVDPKKVFVIRDVHMHKVMRAVALAVRKGTKFVIIDSISALLPGNVAECEEEERKAAIGEHARELTRLLPMLLHEVIQNNAICIVINQIRHLVDVKNPYLKGKTYITGGNALMHYSTLNIELRLEDEDKGVKILSAKVTKNKAGLPQREGLVKLVLGRGIDLAYDIFTFFEMKGLIEHKGAWIAHQGQTYRKFDMIDYIEKHLDYFRTKCTEIMQGKKISENLFKNLKTESE
ncbi:MAG: hypothetical protein QXG39_02825 [Candidatus Aenigmatarchaeota archaeon]